MADARLAELARQAAANPGDQSVQARHVRARIQAGELVAALDAALECWRQHPHAAIAEAVERLDAMAPGYADAPRARTKAAFQPAWLEEAKKPRETQRSGWLAQTLTKLMPTAPEHYGVDAAYVRRKYAAFLERLGALQAHGPDPRIARALLTLIVRTPLSTGFGPPVVLYGPIADLLVEQGDGRHADALQQLIDEPLAKTQTLRDGLAQILPPAVAALRQAAQAREGLNAAPWSDLFVSEAGAEPAAGVEELFAAVYADPGDDAPRHALAKALSAAGDSRGEFIALQLLLEPSAKDLKRCRALLRQHRAEWLGHDLERVLTGVVFERGFPHSASLAGSSAAVPEVWERAKRDPGLATLRGLGKGKGNLQTYAEFVTSPLMRALNFVDVTRWSLLDELAAGATPRALTALGMNAAPRKAQLTTIARSAALRNVDALVAPVPPKHVARLARELEASGLAKRLRRLELYSKRNAPADVEHARALFELRTALPAIEILEVGPVRLEPSESGPECTYSLRLYDQQAREQLLAVVRSLPLDVAALHVQTAWPLEPKLWSDVLEARRDGLVIQTYEKKKSGWVQQRTSEA